MEIMPTFLCCLVIALIKLFRLNLYQSMLKRLTSFAKHPIRFSRHLWPNQQLPNRLLGPLLKFWTSNMKIKLEDVEQKAVVSFFAMEYIMNFKPQMYLKDPRSIRERLVDRCQFERFVLQKSNKVRGDGFFKKFEQLGLQTKNIDQVLDGFQMEKGMIYDPIKFSQKRMTRVSKVQKSIKKKIVQISESSQQKIQKLSVKNQGQIQPLQKEADGIKFNDTTNTQITDHKRYEQIQISIKNQKIVLNPMFHSGVIMNQLFSIQSRIISGDKGIGKSFTYLLYSYLASFILEVRLQQRYFNLFKGFYKQLFQTYQNFYQVEKLFYIALRDINSQGNFQLLLKRQMDQAFFKEKSDYFKPLNSPLQLKEQYQKYEIKSFIVFDEINSFYSDCKKYFKMLAHGIHQDKLFKVLQTKSFAIRLVFQSKVIFNSSQDVEAKLLQFKIRDRNLFDVYEHEDTSKHNIKIDYISFTKIPPGLIQLYGTFWFELTRSLISLGIPQNKIKQKRYIFNKAFNLSGLQQNQPIVSWKNNISPLDLRQALSSSKKLNYMQQQDTNPSLKFLIKLPKQINLEKLGQYFVENATQQLIIKQLHDIKQQIEVVKTVLLQNKLRTFLNHSTDNHDRFVRIAIILQMRSQAYNNQAVGIDTFQVPINGLYQLKVGKAKASDEQKYQTIIPLFQHIDMLLSQLKIGTIDSINNIIMIGYRPTIFLQESSFILKDVQLMMDIYEALIKHNNSLINSTQYGNMVDAGVARLFERGFLNFSYSCYYQAQTKRAITRQQRQSFIGHGTIIQNLAKGKDLRGCLYHMFEDCRKNNYRNYICGVPNTQNNEGYDLVLLRRDGITKAFELITIDVTVGTIQEKLKHKVADSRLYADQCQKYLYSFFKSVFQNKEIRLLNNIKEMITRIKIQQPQLTAQSFTEMALKIAKFVSVRQHIYRQKFEQFTQLTTYTPQNWQKYKQGVADTHLQTILIDIKKRTDENYTWRSLKTTAENVKILFDSIDSQKFKQLCAIVKLVKILQKSKISTYQSLITFVQKCFNHQTNHDNITIIPKQLQGDKRLNFHYFFIPLSLLRAYCQPEALIWTHYIAAPSFRIQQYLNQYKKDVQLAEKNIEASLKKKKTVKQSQKDPVMPFLFQEYSESYGNRMKLLSYGLLQLQFDDKMLQIIKKPSQYKQEDKVFFIMKQQYKLLQTLTQHMSGRFKQK